MKAKALFNKLIAVLSALVLLCFFAPTVLSCGSITNKQAGISNSIGGEVDDPSGDGENTDKPSEDDNSSNNTDDKTEDKTDENGDDKTDENTDNTGDESDDNTNENNEDKTDDNSNDNNEDKTDENTDNTGDESDDNTNENNEDKTDDNNDDNTNENNEDKTDEDIDDEDKPVLTYEFTGADAGKAGYAEGTATLKAPRGDYKLFWADDCGALVGYYEIAALNVPAGGSASYEFGYHVAIPCGATKLIAVSGAVRDVENAVAVYDIPAGKRIAGTKLYSFNSYSDVHIDKDTVVYYKNAEANWAQALRFALNKGSDFIVTSGDMVTNAAGSAEEWKAYNKIIAQSGYSNPIWESDGNHDMRTGVDNGLYSFVYATGTDSTASNFYANKPYYCVTEKTTGDIFIFMALEFGYESHKGDMFSAAQLKWVESILDEYYDTGVNIYLIEHSPIYGYGAGDRMSDPYYKAHIKEDYASTRAFKKLLVEHPKIIWMSGHTHEDFSMGYNYSDDNGRGCYMIHNPAVAGTTIANASDNDLDRNNGRGYNSQGYYVEAYADRVVYYGADLTNELIYPEYCFVMEGGRTQAPAASSVSPTVDSSLSGKTLTAALSAVKTALDGAGKFASYDQYLTLKRLYTSYSAAAPEDTAAAIAELGGALTALKSIVNDINGTAVYFTNNWGWDDVYCYAWDDAGNENATWPGIKISRLFTNEYSQGVYGVRFERYGKYTSVIFNNGSGSQTANIALNGQTGFYLKDGNVKSYDPDYYVRVPFEGDGRYALLYYIESQHDWSAKDAYFKYIGGDKYCIDLKVTGTNNINLCIHDGRRSKYICVPQHGSVAFADDVSKTFAMTAVSSRGSSITVESPKTGGELRLIYDKPNNTVTVYCYKL